MDNQLDLSRNKIGDFVKTLLSLMPSEKKTKENDFPSIDYLRRGFFKEKDCNAID